MDFGIARLVGRPKQLTQVGLVVGTPEYMAPEQLLQEPIDARTDLYAVGVVVYECLTGRRPFQADSPAALIGIKLAGKLEPPTALNASIPPALSALVLRTLSKDIGPRPCSAAEMHDLLVSAGP